MATADDDYGWFDALERMDVVFEDFTSMSELINRLDEVLGRPASAAQIDSAVGLLGFQRQQATDLGFTVDRFTRAGRQVTQLRDRFGRFVASGAKEISRRLARGAG